MSNPTRSPRKSKPRKHEKPYEGFPLFAHATKRWAKKIRGRLVYFGPWDDWKAALDKYDAQKDDLYSGRRPVATDDVLTVEKLVNKFLAFKRHLLDTREITDRTFTEYHAACQRVIESFGWNRPIDDLRPEDFERYRSKYSKRNGPVRLGNEIQRVRSVFKYAYDAGHIDRPIRFGPGFKKPSRKTLRIHKAQQGPKMFERDEIHKLLAGVGIIRGKRHLPGPQLRAMILLGVNCGFGNADCGTLPISAIDLGEGWINYPRPKTGIPRRCKLWPETAAALREVLDRRTTPKDTAHGGLVFITKYGRPWFKEICDSPVTKECRKLLDALGIDGHRNFYCLRHTFETIGGEARDQVAVNAIMGHVDDSMAGHYRERISDERLAAVAAHVRAWLWPAPAQDSEVPAVLPMRTRA